MLGQQSLVGFMGLHVDVDLVHEHNSLKTGVVRKNGCIVNQDDKLTAQQKEDLLLQNETKYGLPSSYISYLWLPRSHAIKVYNINKIVNSKRTLSWAQKISHLEDIQASLTKRLKLI